MDHATCDLSDRFGDKARVLSPLFRHFGGRRRFHGSVITIKCFEDNSRLKELLEEDGAGRVIVVDGGGSVRCALLGDMLATRAADKRWSGVLIHGCVRDTAALASIDLGILALAAMPRRSLKRGEGTIGCAVDLAGTTCHPGDTLVADEDGVVLLDSQVLAGAVVAAGG